MRTMYAKYAGTCAVCAGRIEPGEMIDYERRPGRAAYVAHAGNRCAGNIANPDRGLADQFDRDYRCLRPGEGMTMDTREKLLAAIRRMTDEQLAEAIAETTSDGAWAEALRNEMKSRRYTSGHGRPSRPTAEEESPGYRNAMADAGRGRLLP